MADVSHGPDDVQQELDLAGLIITTLNLEIRPTDIDRDAPLFDDGLGLDSIDILEIALAISQVYGFGLRSDDKDNETIFSSLRNLNAHVQKHRVK
jgi:acyl carrier protein